MHQLIATYLFQNKKCPLPGIGHLFIQQTAAQTDFVNKQIFAPSSVIQFSTNEIENENFLENLSAHSNKTIAEVKKHLQNLFSDQYFSIAGVGSFSKENDKLKFIPTVLEDDLLQPVKANRVVHQNEAHTMVVGDTETTTAAMTEYFAEEEITKDYWWVWALALGGLAIAAIFIYYFVLNN
jgi:hypothetical protein